MEEDAEAWAHRSGNRALDAGGVRLKPWRGLRRLTIDEANAPATSPDGAKSRGDVKIEVDFGNATFSVSDSEPGLTISGQPRIKQWTWQELKMVLPRVLSSTAWKRSRGPQNTELNNDETIG